jgi:hypothetical protein
MSSTNLFFTFLMGITSWFSPNEPVEDEESKKQDKQEQSSNSVQNNQPLTKIHVQSKSLRLITGQTASTLPKGSFELAIQHRFGALSSGSENLFGLDNFNSIRVGFDFGISDRLTAGFGRSSLQKTYNAYSKWRFIGKSDSKVNASYIADVSVDGRPSSQWGLDPFFGSHRLAYTHQLALSYAPTNSTLIGLTPSIVHLNLVEKSNYSNDIPVLGFFARQQVSKKLALTIEGSTLINGIVSTQSKQHPTLGVGFEYYTPQHVFQVNITNSRSMNERYFLIESPNSVGINDFCMGFNLIRRW